MRARCVACLAFLTPDDVAGGRCSLCQSRLDKVSSSPAQPDSPAPVAAKKRRWWLEALYLIALLLSLPGFGVGVFALARYFAPDGWQPAKQEPDLRQLKAALEVSNSIKERQRLERDSQNRRLTLLLRNSKDDSTIEKSLFECFLKGGQTAGLGLLEAQLAMDRDFPLPETRE